MLVKHSFFFAALIQLQLLIVIWYLLLSIISEGKDWMATKQHFHVSLNYYQSVDYTLTKIITPTIFIRLFGNRQSIAVHFSISHRTSLVRPIIFFGFCVFGQLLSTLTHGAFLRGPRRIWKPQMKLQLIAIRQSNRNHFRVLCLVRYLTHTVVKSIHHFKLQRNFGD